MFLVSANTLKTNFTIPNEASADVSLRRIQNMSLKSGDTVAWSFGDAKGQAKADVDGVITIPSLKMTAKPATLTVRK